MVIAIDGPAGAGKSSVARRVAQRLGFRYVDTGAMYRALALAALERGVDADDGAGLAALLERIDVQVRDANVLVDGIDVGARLRGPDVTAIVSAVAAHEEVRAALARLQREVAAQDDVVMEGRDIGSVVVPDAEVKVYLTASLGERARRRWAETDGRATVGDIEKAIAARDAADSEREASPLTRAPDATVIDTTDKTLDAVVDEIVSAVDRVRSGDVRT